MVNGNALVQGKPYEQLQAGKPPIPITVAPPPPASAQLGIHPSQRPRPSPEPSINGSTPPSYLRDGVRRDSGLAPSASTARGSRTTLATDIESARSIKDNPSVPASTGNEARTSSFSKFRQWSGQRNRHSQASKEAPHSASNFHAITTTIPSSSFEDLTSPGRVEFSKRGSMLISGQRVNSNEATIPQVRIGGARRQPSAAQQTASTVSLPTNIPSTISSEDEILSQRVRSLYESGTERGMDVDYPPIEEESQEGATSPRNRTFSAQTYLSASSAMGPQRTPSRTTIGSQSDAASTRDEHELAGGIEDWQDVNVDDVDRYGFIIPRKPAAPGSTSRGASPEPPRLQRVSTLLQLASETPRRNRSSAMRRTASSAHGSARSIQASNNNNPDNSPPSRRNPRPPSSQASYSSSVSRTPSSRLRSMTNRLPHNRDRRTMDEAGDMLTLPPGLADIAESDDAAESRHADALKRREWEREEKWRKMARQVGSNKDGRGMVFDFDTRSPKLIARTWKGIPDRWRATAWHAFLSASAKRRGGGGNGAAMTTMKSDVELVQAFHALQDQTSPDDVQIDIDVPRTISSHIMFRRRYRGGQRLLFRVLHGLSIYFPDTGYVQGMAALAATVLCYYDEEMAFVMLVRMWELRGLKRLYENEFEGLMEALEEFERAWLVGGRVVGNLRDLGIMPTAYGTRWYLTVFNYSIPFAAQLRVWDVFMLLGDPLPSPPPPPPPSASPAASEKKLSLAPSPKGGFDVLHAVGAALISGMREILADSDFENSMKVLTSWIPIRDEELLMRVAKAEWRARRRGR